MALELIIFLGLRGKIRERAFVCNESRKQLKVIDDNNIEIVDILPPDNEIWYKTSNNQIYDFETIIMGIKQMGGTYLGPNISTNLWDEDLQMYRMVFDNSLTAIGVTNDNPIEFYPFFMNNSDYGLLCNVNEIILPSSIISIGIYAFYRCYISSIKIPNNTILINDRAFEESNLSSIKIPSDVSTIGVFAFNNCINLTKIEVDSNNQNYCDIDGVLFTKDMHRLMQYPNAKTTVNYIIPEGVTQIDEWAIHGCDNMLHITLPSTILWLDIAAISLCPYLETVTILATTPPTCGAGYDYEFNDTCSIYVPSESVQTYKTEWPSYADRIYAIQS